MNYTHLYISNCTSGYDDRIGAIVRADFPDFELTLKSSEFF